MNSCFFERKSSKVVGFSRDDGILDARGYTAEIGIEEFSADGRRQEGSEAHGDETEADLERGEGVGCREEGGEGGHDVVLRAVDDAVVEEEEADVFLEDEFEAVEGVGEAEVGVFSFGGWWEG